MSQGGNSGNHYRSGDWLAACDICGFRFYASQLKKNWKGEYVCEADFELRHPQEFIRVPKEDVSVPWVRDETDILLFQCWIWAITAYADLAEADCAQADKAFPTYQNALELKYPGNGLSPAGVPPTIPPNYFCTLVGSTSFAGFGVAGCMLPSNTTGF